MRLIGLVILTLGLTLAPHAVEAQQAGKVRVIGFLSISSHEHIAYPLRALEEGLRELGYVEGQHVTFERRFADGKPERLPELARELLLRVSIIVAYGATSTRAAKNATAAIPIVMIVHPDPVSAGLVASLAHPGGNITGLARLSQELSAKRLALLKEAVPGLTRVAALWYSESRDGERSLQQIEAAAKSLGLQVQVRGVRNPNELESAFSAMKEGRADGLITVPSTMFSDNRTTIAQLALKQRLPAIFPEKEFVEADGLMAYGANLAGEFRRAANYVDKILKGTKPADLPVEQPTKYELVINMKTAKALGLTVPQTIILQADHVIE